MKCDVIENWTHMFHSYVVIERTLSLQELSLSKTFLVSLVMHILEANLHDLFYEERTRSETILFTFYWNEKSLPIVSNLQLFQLWCAFGVITESCKSIAFGRGKYLVSVCTCGFGDQRSFPLPLWKRPRGTLFLAKSIESPFLIPYLSSDLVEEKTSSSTFFDGTLRVFLWQWCRACLGLHWSTDLSCVWFEVDEFLLFQWDFNRSLALMGSSIWTKPEFGFISISSSSSLRLVSVEDEEDFRFLSSSIEAMRSCCRALQLLWWPCTRWFNEAQTPSKDCADWLFGLRCCGVWGCNILHLHSRSLLNEQAKSYRVVA